MKNLYLGLKARIEAQCPTIKYVGAWNNQVANMVDPDGNKIYSFGLPAVFFEFQNDNPVDQVGNNVLVYDPLDIIVHIVHDFYNASDGTMEVNLAIFDVEAEVHNALQLWKVTGVDYGSGPIGRVGQSRDYDHSNVYHSMPLFRTTWTDNSRSLPIGGYEVGPTLLADLTVEKLPLAIPDINVSTALLAFGDVTVGQTATLQFTVDGTNLKDLLVLAAGSSLFGISFDNVNFSSLQMITPIEKVVALTTVYVKFSPTALGAISEVLNYGTTGFTGTISLTGTGI